MPNGEPAMPGTVELDLHSFRDRIAEPPDLPAVIEEYFAHTDTESALGFVFIGKETGEEKVRGKRLKGEQIKTFGMNAGLRCACFRSYSSRSRFFMPSYSVGL